MKQNVKNVYIGQFYEMEQLNNEIKRLKNILDIERKRIKEQITKKQDRIKELESFIIKGMIESDIKELEYKGKKFKPTPKIKHVRKNNKSKKTDILNVLKDNVEPEKLEEIYQNLEKAMKGDEHLDLILN